MRKVYIASPYKIGDKNALKSFNIVDDLIVAGFAPYYPVWNFTETRHDDEAFLDIVSEWVKACDYVLRLPGESKGADLEVETAMKAGISVFGTIDALIEYDLYGRETNDIE